MKPKFFIGITLSVTLLYAIVVFFFMNKPTTIDELNSSKVLTIWGWDETIPSAFDEYQLSHSDVSLNFVYVEKNEYANKLKLSLALQEGLPDICILENEMLDDFISEDLFVDLSCTPFSLKEDDILENRLMEVRSENGGLWGVPATPGSSGIAYNRNLALDFLNTDDPNQIAVVYNSWADVISKGKTFVQMYQNKSMFASLEDAAVMMYGQSKEPYIINETMSQPYKFLNYFSILEALRDEGLVKNYQQYSPQWLNSFQSDDVFFYPCPLWLIHLGVFESDQTWGYTVPPSGAYQWGGTIWAIPSSSSNQALAWDFMQTILLTPAGAMYNKNKENGTFISYQKAYEIDGYRDLFIDDFGNQNIGQYYFDEILPSMRDYQQSENSSQLRAIYIDVVQAMAQIDDMDAKQAYDLFLSELFATMPNLKVVE